LWDNEPERRSKVVLGLAQQPAGDNWSYLVRSLPLLDVNSAGDVLVRLRTVNQNAEDPEQIRQVILTGLRLQEKGVKPMVDLLQHWTGQELLDPNAPWQNHLKAWQDWYADEFPDRPRAELPVAAAESKWKIEELTEHLSSELGGKGSLTQGAAVFEKATCSKCHRIGQRGDSIGPDLTSVSRRFTKREVLESIVFPSHIISDQYASKTVITTSGKTYNGLLGTGAPGERVVLQNDGKKITIQEAEIDQIIPTTKSVMPDNLLDSLSLEEISDLFAFLGLVPSSQDVARRPGEQGDTKQK
jgi:putative heme-binding domain-containing protein